jgi:uncharacterized membrane protein YkvA (DUF1232 family)
MTNGFSPTIRDALITSVKKKKRIKAVRIKRPAAKAKQLPALKRRMDAEFAKALQSAKTYLEDASRLNGLFDEAVTELASMPRNEFAETWPYFCAMLRLVRAYADAGYRDISASTLVVIVAAVIYVVDPLDMIPDAVPGLGFLDDATVVALAIKRSRDALDQFMAWELRHR